MSIEEEEILWNIKWELVAKGQSIFLLVSEDLVTQMWAGKNMFLFIICYPFTKPSLWCTQEGGREKDKMKKKMWVWGCK